MNVSSQIPQSAMAEFFAEADEILQRFSGGLSSIEKNGHDSETIASLYRDMHTLKGTAQLFGFKSIGQTAHAIEAILEPIRRLKLQTPIGLLDVIFKSVDLLDRLVKCAAEGNAGDADLEAEVKQTVPLLIEGATRMFAAEYIVERDTLPVSEGYRDLPAAKIEILKKDGPMALTAVEPQKDAVKTEHAKDDTGGSSGDATSTIRIQVGLLDRLMNLVGEMVLVRNQFLQYSQKHDESEFLNLSQRLNLVTSELQGEVMKTRMQPIGSVLAKFQRLIRDLSKDLGKQIEITVQGSETELDKTLLEAIKDPLTHIIRNSCDHGIEMPEERIANGKSPVGHILVRAYHEGGQVILEITDDGKGLNNSRILEKAIERKIITPERAKSMSDREIGALIFAPGFSTAEKVTAVSGRGVGMDVVKTNLEKVGGIIEINSVAKKGMTLKMRIPLTLAIVPALLVRSQNENFAVPQVKLVELVRVEPDGNGPKIELLQGKQVIRLRGALLSLVTLSEVLGLKEAPTLSESANIVVLQGEGDVFGLIVDEIKDTADIVVKPLPQFLKRLMAFSGATIMGDGSVALILDISGIAQRAHLHKPESAHEKGFALDDIGSMKKISSDAQDFLFFNLNTPEQYCMPLCLLNRLEEFKAADVEYSGSQRVVQYRDSILPLISLNDFLKLSIAKAAGGAAGATVRDEDEPVSVIVVPKRGKLYGIQVNSVADIMNVDHTIEDSVIETRGILGSVIVGDSVSTVVDVLSVIDAVTGYSAKKASELPAGATVKGEDERNVSGLKCLLVEDTVFFVKQIKKTLEKFGIKVTHAGDGEEAWSLLEVSKPGDFDFILSDIEMPKMNGFELCEKIRAHSAWGKTPTIALTTRFRDVDIEKGKEVGFNRYLEKLKPDVLLEAIDQLVVSKRSSGKRTV